MGDDVSFLASNLLDSTGVLELVEFLEQRFALRIEDTEIVPANLDSLSRIAAFIERKQGVGHDVQAA
jgi:acyl carrier protein